MSESIAEMVIPGTYIEVRAEGLIAVGAIATGNLGIVGTAARGPVDAARAIGSLAEAVEIYGQPDPFTVPRTAGAPLSLVRTLEQAFAGGARNVFAVRIATARPSAASLKVNAAGAVDAFTLTARGTRGPAGTDIADTSGTWGRDITVEVVPDTTVTPAIDRLTLRYRGGREVHEGRTVADVHESLKKSALVSVEAAPANPTVRLLALPTTALSGGVDNADVGAAQVAAGLTVLESQPVNILLVAGLGSNRIGAAVQAHVDRTEATGRERMAVLGVSGPGGETDVAALLDDAEATSDDRIVLVAPGLLAPAGADGAQIALPPSYLAAVVAGRLSTLAPHVSLTNKVLPATPDVHHSTAAAQSLLQGRILVVRRKVGNQVVKGITSSPPPFDKISIRRIVDYAKAGVRLGADPYIGRLNNLRVRAALKATLDGFLSQMVLDEMLVGYTLAVTATRAQERAGVCAVVMTLQPTFSIDFVRVTMNLE